MKRVPFSKGKFLDLTAMDKACAERGDFLLVIPGLLADARDPGRGAPGRDYLR